MQRQLERKIEGEISLADLGDEVVKVVLSNIYAYDLIAAYMLYHTTASLADMFTEEQKNVFNNLPLMLVIEADEWAMSSLRLKQTLELFSFLPLMMFQHHRVKNAAGKVIQASPLEHVFETGNVYLQQEFKKLVAKSRYFHMFVSQATAAPTYSQKEYEASLDLGYELLLNQYPRLERDYDDYEWFMTDIGRENLYPAQVKLPVHAFAGFFGPSWTPESDFSDLTPSVSDEVYDWESLSTVEVKSGLFNQEIGLPLARGADLPTPERLTCFITHDTAQHDKDCFAKFFAKRHQQQNELIAATQQEIENNKKIML